MIRSESLELSVIYSKISEYGAIDKHVWTCLIHDEILHSYMKQLQIEILKLNHMVQYYDKFEHVWT